MKEIIKKSKESEAKKSSEQFLMLLDNDLDPDELYFALCKENIKLNYLNMNLLFQKIKLLSNKHIKRFQQAIIHRCQDSNIEEIRVSDYDGLVNHSKVIKDYIDGIEKDKDERPILLSLYLLMLLYKELEKIIEKFQSNDK